MFKRLRIDTSNYTTSIAVVDNNELISDNRLLLNVKSGERGLRQSEAPFSAYKNSPNSFK
jgi:N6-L-threonylcarbamoyladenine synthase